MVTIPPGDFEMGSSPEEVETAMARFGVARREMFAAEIPRHRVEVDPFALSRHPVTNSEFRRFLMENPEWNRQNISDRFHNGKYLSHWRKNEFPENLVDVPVVNVSWYAAEAYCRWQLGHLPTEAQWEWAARGGMVDPEFPWGDQDPSDSLVNWSGDGIDHAVKSESYPPNGYGLYDMAGNVWQFCLDEWQGDAYRTAEIRNPLVGAETADFDFRQVRTRRVIRGGSWGAAAINMRVTFRDSHPPEGAGDHVGFRCARSLRNRP